MDFLNRLRGSRKWFLIIFLVFLAGAGYVFFKFYTNNRVLTVSEVSGFELSIKNRKGLDKFLSGVGFWEFRWDAANTGNIKQLRVVFTDKPQGLMTDVFDDGRPRSSYSYQVSENGLVLNLFVQVAVGSGVNIEQAGAEAQYWLMRMVYDTYIKETGVVVSGKDTVFFEEKDYFSLFSDQERFFELEEAI